MATTRNAEMAVEQALRRVVDKALKYLDEEEVRRIVESELNKKRS